MKKQIHLIKKRILKEIYYKMKMLQEHILKMFIKLNYKDKIILLISKKIKEFKIYNKA
jgi:hypothetical protein